MNRSWHIAALVAVALALPAVAQIRGVPASVTSMAPGRSFNPGPPASVTSLGPNGYSSPCGSVGPLVPSAMGCTPTQFTSGFFYPDGRDRGPVNLRSKRHRRDYRGAYPIYVPYAYPVADGGEPEVDEQAGPDSPAPTIFEHRPFRAAPSPSGASSQLAPQPAGAPDELSPSDARQQIPVVLIYLDGHEQQVTNYAIVGQTLYDLGTFVAHKIPLAELNLQATVKANDDRGVEFNVPAWVKAD
jgi:hypothetical protein